MSMTPEEERNTGIMHRWFTGGAYGAVSDEEAEAYVDAHYAVDGRAYGLGDQFVEGPGPFKAFRKVFVDAFDELAFDVKHCFGQGDRVALYWEASAIAKGTKGRVVFNGGGIVRMKDGQIVEAWNLVNFTELLEQLAVLPEGAVVTAFAEQAAGG